MQANVGALLYLLAKYDVPMGWREVCVGDLAEIVGGATPKRDEQGYWRNGTIPWVTPTDITAQRSKYITDSAEKISEAGYKNSSVRLLPRGTIICSTRGTIGSIAIAGVPLTSNQSCENLIPKSSVDSEFLYYLLNFIKPIFTTRHFCGLL